MPLSIHCQHRPGRSQTQSALLQICWVSISEFIWISLFRLTSVILIISFECTDQMRCVSEKLLSQSSKGWLLHSADSRNSKGEKHLKPCHRDRRGTLSLAVSLACSQNAWTYTPLHESRVHFLQRNKTTFNYVITHQVILVRDGVQWQNQEHLCLAHVGLETNSGFLNIRWLAST